MADDVNAIDLHVVEQLGQIIGHLLIGESPPGDHVGCRTFPVNVNFAGTLRCRSCAFRAALRPRKKAGRKPDEATARAAEMWSAGIKRGNQRDLWQRIYGEVFSDFHRMDKLTRQHRTHTLRRKRKTTRTSAARPARARRARIADARPAERNPKRHWYWFG